MMSTVGRPDRRPRLRWRLRWLGAVGALVLALAAGTLHGASAQDDEPRSAKVVFTERNDSGVEGSAGLRRRGDRTDVEIETDGALGDHPTHIHEGSCDDLDPNPQFPLTNVRLRTAGLTGSSVTTVDVPLSALLDEPHLILIHKSAKDIGTYIACGDIVPGRLTAAERASTGTGGALPGTGTGSATDGPGATGAGPLVAALAALVAGLVLAVPRARRR